MIDKILKWILPISVIVLLIIFFKKIMQILGLSPSDAETQLNDNLKSSVKVALSELAAKGIRPTNTDAYFLGVADSIYNDLSVLFLFTDTKDAISQVSKCNNDADIYTLVIQYGLRQLHVFEDKKDLPATITARLSSSEITTLNNQLKQKNITYAF